MTTTQEKAAAFHALHRRGEPLVLANAWDVASARLVEEAGAKAVATTSAAVAWSLGAPDGDRLALDAAIELIGRVAAAVSVPVTADVENGFALTPSGVGETIRGVLAAGAVGVNIEDTVYSESGISLRDVAEQAERLAAARSAADAAGVDLFINARIDTFLRAVGDPATRLDATVARATAFVRAGASGIFVPGVVDATTISALVSAIDAPLNILIGRVPLPIPEIAALGVARISFGSSIAAAAYGLVDRAAREIFGDGTYTAIADAIDYDRLNKIIGG